MTASGVCSIAKFDAQLLLASGRLKIALNATFICILTPWNGMPSNSCKEHLALPWNRSSLGFAYHMQGCYFAALCHSPVKHDPGWRLLTLDTDDMTSSADAHLLSLCNCSRSSTLRSCSVMTWSPGMQLDYLTDGFRLRSSKASIAERDAAAQ